MKVQASLVLVTVLATVCSVAVGQTGPDANEKPAQDSATAAAPVGSKDRPAIVSSGVAAGLLLNKVDPVYPDEAREENISGAVVLLVTIDDQGKIAKLSVIAGPERLRNAALDAVNQWKYKPYLLNGKPAFVKTQITINFNFAR